jgi:hypothetical protein
MPVSQTLNAVVEWASCLLQGEATGKMPVPQELNLAEEIQTLIPVSVS